MIVFAVTYEDSPYHPRGVLGLFDNKLKATQFQEEYAKDQGDWGVETFIEEMVVE